MESENSFIITFRLRAATHQKLAALAEKSGITKHALARSIVARDIDATHFQQMISNLAAIEDEITALRQSLARGIAAILQNVTELDEQAIRDWVDQKLLGRQDPSDEKTQPEDENEEEGEEKEDES